MHVPDDPILWKDPLWSALERAIRAIRKRPNFVLSKPDYVDGLNRTTVNRLSKEAALSDRPVFEVRDDKGIDGRVVRRWLQVNPPGPADAIKIKVWERILPFPIPQSDCEDVIDYLRAWQEKRAEQLKSRKTKATGKAKRKQRRVGIRRLTPRQKEAMDLKNNRYTHGQIAKEMGLKNESSVVALLNRGEATERLIEAEVRRVRASGQSIRSNVSVDSLEGGKSDD